MNIQSESPTYILGQAPSSEFRLELLDEVSCPKFVEALEVVPKRQVRLLNVGCGSGHLEARLAQRFFDSYFVGIDISAKRIEEARARTVAIGSSNSFSFLQADLTSLSLSELSPCDILIFRFVLSHLTDSLKQFARFLPLVRPGGFICIEEVASDGHEYYCNSKNLGYRTFVEMADRQRREQKSSFETGFFLLSTLQQLSMNVLHCQVMQAILRSARHKSILRLGLEEAKPTFLKYLSVERFEETMGSLRQFEQDEAAFGLYTRSLAIIAQTNAMH